MIRFDLKLLPLLLVLPLSLAGCGTTAPSISYQTNTPSLTSNQSATFQAKGTEDDMHLAIAPSVQTFGFVLKDLCNPNIDTTQKLQKKLELMENMDGMFARILSIRKPVMFGVDKYNYYCKEASLGRQCFSEFNKNRDQLNANDIARDMLRHLVNIVANGSSNGAVFNWSESKIFHKSYQYQVTLPDLKVLGFETQSSLSNKLLPVGEFYPLK